MSTLSATSDKPSLQRLATITLRSASNLAKSCVTSLLLTSHSPYLTQYLKPEKVYVGVPNEDGVAYFRKMRPSKVKGAVAAAYNHGFGLGEYLFSLMSDDGDGARVLRGLLED